MSSIKVDQALINTFIDSSFGVGIAYENMPYNPTAAYAELIVLGNDTTALSVNDSDETDGVFRIILRYPVGAGAMVAKIKAEEILAVYSIGKKLTYSTQSLIIFSNSRGQGTVVDGWYQIVLSVSYRAFINR